MDPAVKSRLEEAGKITLSQDEWQNVQDACDLYVLWMSHEREMPAAKDVLAHTDAVSKAAKKLDDELGKLFTSTKTGMAAKEEARLAIKAHLRRSERTVEEARRFVEQLRKASTLAHQKIKNESKGRSGYPVSEAQRNFIHRLVEIYTRAGGRATTSYSSHRSEEEARGGRFVEFVWGIQGVLPRDCAIRGNKSLLGDYIRNYLKSKRSGAGKTPKK